ncbi:hypothetical protein G6L78_01305 [Agrobacterium rhizogenes]|nr:hypothetical protein [Rhizobium rhizogenes]
MKNVLNIRLQNKGLISRMQQEADRLGCDPRQLAVAVLMITFKDGMVDGILDGDDPRAFAPHYAQAKPRLLRGVRQTQFLEWLRDKLGGADSVAFSYVAAAKELGWSVPDTGRVARTLRARGEIIMTRSGKRNHPSSWALVPVRTMEDAA